MPITAPNNAPNRTTGETGYAEWLSLKVGGSDATFAITIEKDEQPRAHMSTSRLRAIAAKKKMPQSWYDRPEEKDLY